MQPDLKFIQTAGGLILTFSLVLLGKLTGLQLGLLLSWSYQPPVNCLMWKCFGECFLVWTSPHSVSNRDTSSGNSRVFLMSTSPPGKTLWATGPELEEGTVSHFSRNDSGKTSQTSIGIAFSTQKLNWEEGN